MGNILNSKRSLELSFGVIFSIIAGSVILLLAVYTASRFVQTEQYAGYSQSAAALGNLLSPVVNIVSTEYAPAPVKFSKETRIYTDCYNTSAKSPVFGRQTLAFSEESSLLKKWSEPGANISRYNKYIFAEDMMSGKTLYIFAKPLHFGFKVDDLIYLSMNDYCFAGEVPEFVKEDIETFERNMNYSARTADCKKDSVKVCFGFEDDQCSMTAYPDENEDSGMISGAIAKDGQNLKYIGENLFYAAVFSSPENYECNMKRLGMKAYELASIYLEKINIVKEKECNSAVGEELNSIREIAKNLSSSKLNGIYELASEMDGKNCRSECRIYAPEEGAC